MATLHHQLPHAVHPPRLHNRTRTTLAAGLLAGLLLATPTAHAAPADRIGDAQTAHGAAAAEVAAIQARVTEAEETLQRMTIEAEAASGAALAAAGGSDRGHDGGVGHGRRAGRRPRRGRPDARTTSPIWAARPTWAATTPSATSRSSWTPTVPTEVLQQAATLEVLGKERTEQLEEPGGRRGRGGPGG